MRRVGWAVSAALAAALLAGCGGSDEPAPDRVRASLLQPSDLPETAEYFYPTQPGSGGSRVEKSWGCYASVLDVIEDSGYINDYVAYKLNNLGRVYSFRYTNKVRNAADDLEDMATRWRVCDKLGYNNVVPLGPTRGKYLVSEVDHGANAFGFRTTLEGEVYGETAFTVVDNAIVQVTAIGQRSDQPTKLDVTRLLAAAVKRAS